MKQDDPQQPIHVRPILAAERAWVSAEFTRQFGSPDIDSRERFFETLSLPKSTASRRGNVWNPYCQGLFGKLDTLTCYRLH